MRRLALLTALALAATVPQAVAASSNFTIRGAGFGHGIGLSQYGAYGYAAHGSNWKDIVLHYYTGTRLGNAAGQTIRKIPGFVRMALRRHGHFLPAMVAPPDGLFSVLAAT